MATQECVCIMSGDLETEPEAVERMFQKMKETGADVVIGSRWDKGGGFQNYDRIKYVLNWIFQKMFKVIYWTHINDLTYGFKILRKHVIDSRLPLRAGSDGLDRPQRRAKRQYIHAQLWIRKACIEGASGLLRTRLPPERFRCQ